MGLPIDAKTDWQAACNEEALLCSPKTLRNAFRFIVSVLGENVINAPKVTLPPLNTNCCNGWSRSRSRRSSPPLSARRPRFLSCSRCTLSAGQSCSLLRGAISTLLAILLAVCLRSKSRSDFSGRLSLFLPSGRLNPDRFRTDLPIGFRFACYIISLRANMNAAASLSLEIKSPRNFTNSPTNSR